MGFSLVKSYSCSGSVGGASELSVGGEFNPIQRGCTGGQWVKTLLTLEPTYLATLCGIAQDKDK